MPSQNYGNVVTVATQLKSVLNQHRSLKKAAFSAVGALTLVGTTILPQVQAQAPERWLEVQRIAGSVSVRTNQSRAAQIGDRLSQPGNSLTTGSASSSNLTLDDGIGSIAVAQNTHLAVQRLDTLPDGAKVSIVDVSRGQARIQARPFTHPNTILELRTPSGVAAVRGTEFGLTVAEDGKTSVGTLEGQVNVTAESVTVRVNADEVSTIRPGEPPTTPAPLDRVLDIEWFTQERRGNILFLSGRIDPSNVLLFEGEEIEISRSGYFEQQVRSARRNRSIAFTVQNPLGETRLHPVSLWRLPDLDRGSNQDGE
ncbi:FecR family protein [Oscillatoria sp. CS-180]|uniref:FecR family protein n=1 Tax=Oscillatoria sp. CS-180 TaxID=3021720 RepID=UPI00232D41DE|nr:FecR family protein [Oscillatoria sp. CS-180]MDB9528366.1 FecR family protein [Oscillatoria sp. CS-180]